MNTEFDLIQLTNSIHWWLSYTSAVGRSYILAESSIKYPLTEYLERTSPNRIELEFPHPKLVNRHIDIYFEDSTKIKSAIEFKYVKNKSTTKKAEKQRVFNDIMRLYLTLESGMKGYLIICGSQKDFLTDFQSLSATRSEDTGTLPKDAFIKPYSESKTISKFEPKGFYTKWFKFKAEDREVSIDINNGDSVTDEFYKGFLKEYSESYETDKPEQSFKIKTRLLHISNDIDNDYKFYQPAKVAIWEILKE